MQVMAGKKHSNPDQFDAWLRDEMLRRELTQSEFARKTGVSQSLVSQWVNGQRTPSILSAKAIAEGLDVPIELVLGRLGLDPRNQIPQADHRQSTTTHHVNAPGTPASGNAGSVSAVPSSG